MTTTTTTTNPNGGDPSSTATALKDANAQLQSLNRVSHKLAMVDNAQKLQTVLDKLLPRLLQRIGDNNQARLELKSKLQSALTSTHGNSSGNSSGNGNSNSTDANTNHNLQLESVLSKIHAKLVEMLSHVMKRVRDDPECRLTNARGILDLLLVVVESDGESNGNTATVVDRHKTRTRTSAREHVDPFCCNLSLAFLGLAVPRCTLPELEGLLPGLLVLHHSRETRARSQVATATAIATAAVRNQWHQVSHLLLRTLERIVECDETSGNHASNRRKKMPAMAAAAGTNLTKTSTKTTNTPSHKRIKTDNRHRSGQPVTAVAEGELLPRLSGLDEARWLLSCDDGDDDEPQNVPKTENENGEKTENDPPLFSIADATYGLVLDALLYQTQVGNVPPPGMSSSGWERLKSGHSSTEKNWEAEMAPPRRLATLKHRLLEWIAPHRRFGLFLGNVRVNVGDTTSGALAMGLSRTVALLVTAAGDPMKGVAETAKQYLKQYLDTHRDTGGEALGDSPALSREVLSLCVGGINAESVLSSSSSSSSSTGRVVTVRMLGIRNGGVSFRRRQVSDSHFAELASAATKAMDDLPEIHVSPVGKLAVLASDKMLSRMGNSLGLGSVRGKPYVAAAELLNGLVIKLEKRRVRSSSSSSSSGSYSTDFGIEARILVLAARILAPVAVAPTAASVPIGEASVAVRDSVYGTVSLLCRSSSGFARDGFLCLLAAGDTTRATSVTTDLLQLLFRCLGNEIDKLRPRATAALDALLESCKRVVDRRNGVEQSAGQRYAQSPAAASANPWGSASANPWGSPPATPARQEQNEIASAAVSAAVSAAATATTLSPSAIATQLGRSVLPILWVASQASQPRQSRVAAARWSSDLLLELDVIRGTHILSFLAGDSDVTAASIAREGLGLEGSKSAAATSLAAAATTTTTTAPIADFEDLVRVLVTEDDPKGSSALGSSLQPSFWDFSPNGKAVAIRCMLRSYLDDFSGGEDGLGVFVEVLTKCLAWKELGGSDDVLDASSEALSVCTASRTARSMILSSSLPLDANGLRDKILSTTSAKAKRLLADAFGNLMADTELFGPHWIGALTEALALSSRHLAVQPFKPTSDLQGAALLGGISVRLVRLHPTIASDAATCETACNLWKRLGSALSHKDDLIGNVFCDAIALSCSGAGAGGSAPALYERLQPGMTSLLTSIAIALNKFGHGDCVNAPRVLKLIDPTGLALGASSGVPEQSDCVSALFRLLGSDAFRKDEEIGLAIGEALALYAEAYAAVDADSSSSTDTEDWPLTMDEAFAKSLSPPGKVIFTLLRTAKSTSNNHKRRACASALLAVVARATRLRVDTNLRKCLQRTLHEIQDCFLFLLVDAKSNQMSRESCCLGLAACNKLVVASQSDELKSRLLRSFGTTTNHGGSAMQETSEQAAQRRRAEGAGNAGDSAETAGSGVDVGGAGGVSEAALGAYREMASAAVASGRPDILYSMLILSVSHPIWFSTEKRRDSYGPSSLQGNNFNNEEVKIALRPFLSKLLPRILRASYDPNKRTREQMETLWVGLTGGGEEGRKAITENLRPTMDALVEETSSKFWRARVGACGALGQICVGRSWADLGGGPAILDENYDLVISKTSSDSTQAGIRLLRLWRAVIRALDDVRITVRESGESLGRSVRSLTIFLCNPRLENPDGSTQHSAERERDAVSASATVLRWLLRNGLKQQCAEAAGICISALIGIIDIAKPAILEALLSDVIYALLMAMSNLEPAAFSYLAVRGERGSDEYENLARLRIQVSQNSPLATALRKCIDLVPRARSLKYQEAVVPALESAISKSSGMATRTAAAECVITLCTTCPHMFQSSTSSGPLLRCFFDAVYRERGGKAAQDKMNSAFGGLSALCPGPAVRQLASVATDRYKEAHGNNDDPATRHASALVLRSIAVKASQQFSNPGNTDVWCRKVLPMSFLGMRDIDKATASLWREVWEDGGAAVDLGSSNNNTGNTLEENLLLGLTKECVKALEDRSWSRRVTGAVALASLAEKEILAPPPRRLNGTYSGSEQARARKRANASRIGLFSLVQLVARNRIWTGKHEVVRAAIQVLRAWIPVAVAEEAKGLLGDLVLRPVIFGDSTFDKDLFVGDAFFLKKVKENNAISDESDCEDDSIPSAEPCSTTEIPPLAIPGICRLLLMQSFPSKNSLRSVATEEVLPYRSSVLQTLEMLLEALPDTDDGSKFRQSIVSYLTPKLWDVFRHTTSNQSSPTESPLIVARSIHCFSSSLWPGMELTQVENISEMDSSVLSQTFLFHVDFTKQSAWTVREAAAKGASRLARCADFQTLQRRQAVSTLVEIAGIALKDRRFWKVRFGGLEILQSLVLRVGDGSQAGAGHGLSTTMQEKQMVLETVLPYKENIQALAKRSLNDSEAKVTALSTNILGVLSTWP
eukprot:CAMPEP_0172363244 /NCGR_PEP_ID=MMETSP1060-20121228/6658_1 /TAXON_ID=37318 /ORGANISM="Pseudo-nitzschia pungens, Strain cf. cingulata" /LENGTH=2421 /DNA_ID=CAMNT_0013085947 /DNA_START=205 /DNA_END=7470 /DNA_ORIENTATION=-